MIEDVHCKARRLILESRIKDLLRSDQILLEEHLNICPVCRKYRDGTDAVILSFRNTSVAMDPELVRSTQQLVRARARELNSRANLNPVAAWIAALVTLMWIAATVPYLWRGFEWIGKRMGISNLIWQMGFGLWWLLPALVLAAVLATRPSPNGAYRKS
jgi:predicted anti-sigma-YlaC factor YlaD